MTSAGWVHRFVVAGEAVIAVAPTSTTLVAFDASSHTSVSGIITNSSLTQEIAVSAETSFNGSTHWAPLNALNATQFIEPIAPGESRHMQFDSTDLRSVRLIGVASGAGCDAVVSIQQIHVLPVR